MAVRSAGSRGHLSRYQSQRESGNSGMRLFTLDGQEYAQRMPLLRPSGQLHDVPYATTASGDVPSSLQAKF